VYLLALSAIKRLIFRVTLFTILIIGLLAYWLIGKGKGNGFIDTKRIGPVLFLYLYVVLAWMFFYTVYKGEFYSYLLTTGTGQHFSRFEYIGWRIEGLWSRGKIWFLLDGLFFPIVYFL
jgi:hypothetical protein